MIADANLRPVKLKAIREARGLTKTELSRSSGVNPADIGRIETGRLIPYDSQITRLAQALGVDNPKTLVEALEG